MNSRFLPFLLILLFFSVSEFWGSGHRDSVFSAGDPQPGDFRKEKEGILYLPEGWSPDREELYPVLVVLTGFSISNRVLSSYPQWKEGSDRNDIVLFFPDRDHMGWYEDPKSEDSKRLRNILKGFRSIPWVRDDSVYLFGFSAGAIMATSMLSQKDSPWRAPLFDRLYAASGGIGYGLEQHLKKDPHLQEITPIPVRLYWGERESPGAGPDVLDFFMKKDWDVRGFSHPGAHWLLGDHILQILESAGKPGI